MTFKSDETLSQLRELVESSSDFRSQVEAFRIWFGSYRNLAKTILITGAVWDGGGHGAVQSFHANLMKLEQQENSIVIGDLRQLLQDVDLSIPGQLGEPIKRFSTEFGQPVIEVAQVAMQEMVRRMIVDTIQDTKDAYTVQFGKVAWDEEMLLSAQQALRDALSFPV
jgi:hypothetical protein